MARILSIAYDPMLLSTRKLILEKHGYNVVSAEGFIQALRKCNERNYDLVIMGHSVPYDDKLALFETISRECPVPVVSLIRGTERDLPGAAAKINPFDQQALLDTIDRLITQDRKERA